MGGVVFFSTVNCSYCKPIKEIISRLKTEYEDEPFTFVSIVVDEDANNLAMARNWGVQGVPTLVFIKDAEEIARIVGATTEEIIVEHVERCLQPDVLQESPRGSDDSSDSVLCDTGQPSNG